jgi:hypothetical protein
VTAAIATRTAGRRGVAATVTVRASELSDLENELTAERAESRDFAERVRVGAARIRAAIATGSDMAAINEAGKIGYLADRRLAQLGSVVL